MIWLTAASGPGGANGDYELADGCLRSGSQRFFEGRLAFRFPLSFSGVANVREWWDEDAQRFRIEVHVANRFLGPLCGYRGSFTVTEHPCTDADIPVDVRPLREEARE